MTAMKNKVSCPLNKYCKSVSLLIVGFVLITQMTHGNMRAENAIIEQDSVLLKEEIEGAELTTFKLPELQILLDSAVALSPERRYALLIAEEERINYKMAKINLLQMISVRASYNYGDISGNFMQESEIYQPLMSYSRSKQDYFNAGVYLSVPIGEVVNLRQKKKIMQLRIQRQIEDGERVAREVKIGVINEYNKFQLAMNNLKAKSDKLNYNKVQYVLAQKKFEKGIVDIHALTNVATAYSDARVDYENTLGEVRVCLLMLETLTGLTLINE